MVTDAQSTICGLRASTTRVPEPAASSADQMAYATGGTALVAQGSWVQRGDELYFVPYPAVASVMIKAFANEAAGIPWGWLRWRILDGRRGNAYYRRLTPDAAGTGAIGVAPVSAGGRGDARWLG